MVSNNYSAIFQPLPSQEVRVVPYIEPAFVPTFGKLFLTCNQYTIQNEDGTYTVNVNLLHNKEGITIEHVSNGNLLMRIQIVLEKLSDYKSRTEYLSLAMKYSKLLSAHYRHLDEKDKAFYAEKEMERKIARAERDLELQRIYEKANNHPIILVGDFVVNNATNIAVLAKDITQNALIVTRDTAIKTAIVAKENISKLVFFCSYTLVRVKPSEGVGNNYDVQRHVENWKPIQFNFQSILQRQKRDSIFKQTSQDTSYSHSPIAQLLYNKKKM